MQNMPIAIFRGDDTDALGYQTIVGTIRTDLDLTGCKAVFKYLSFSVEFDPIPEDKKLTVIIPASETAKFPPGLGYASLRVFDSEGKLCTFSNRIMVFVATKTPMFGNAEFEVDFNVRPELEPLKIFVGPNPDDFDEYRGFLEKVIDRASAAKYGLAMLLDAIDSDLGADDGVAATPAAVKAAYAAVIGKLTDEYYTKEETEEAIDRVAAYYITYDAVGHAFPTHADLANAQTYYSGGKARTPTRNDYAIVLADETHEGSEYRYIYAVPEGQTVGQWEPQYPVEGVMTVDQTVTRNSQNPVSGGGVWSAIWGALAALPTGFSSLYDWVVAQLAGKVSKTGDTMTGGLTVPNFTVGSRKSDSTVGINSTAEGFHTKASGVNSHAEGANTEASGESTHAEGYNATAQNSVEHAQGRFNASHKASTTFGDAGNTLSSIGFGTADNARKNAVEVMQDGKTFIYGLGEYNGTNPTNATDLATSLNGKQSALSDAQLANIAAVSNALAFDATHSYAAGDPVVYDGTLYTFTEAHTGAWTGSDVSAVDIIARLAEKADKPATFTTGNLAALDTDGNLKDSGKSLDDISQEIQDAIGYAVVVEDNLVPIDGPGTSVIEKFQSEVTTWLSAQLPSWASNANKNAAVFRNRPVNNNYYYNCPDLLNRVALWIGDVNKDEGQTSGYMERSLVFPTAGVYSVDVEYAVGLTYQKANAPRFLVSVGGETQEVIGTRQTNVLQTGHLIFNVQAGSRAIRLTATPGLGDNENAAAVVIASLKVTLVKEDILAGQSFNLASEDGINAALTAVIEKLGGSVE